MYIYTYTHAYIAEFVSVYISLPIHRLSGAKQLLSSCLCVVVLQPLGGGNNDDNAETTKD